MLVSVCYYAQCQYYYISHTIVVLCRHHFSFLLVSQLPNTTQLHNELQYKFCVCIYIYIYVCILYNIFMFFHDCIFIYIYIYIYVVRSPPPSSFLKGGAVNFKYLPWRGESEKLKKKGGSGTFPN